MRSNAERRRVLRWLGAGIILFATYAGTCAALEWMTDSPRPLGIWIAAGLVVIPLAWAAALLFDSRRAAAVALAESMALAGLAALVLGTYLVMVIGINGPPHGHERDVLLASLASALIVVALVGPVRHRVLEFAQTVVGTPEPSMDDAFAGFAARMSRAVPMDELMLQLAESLRSDVADAGAEIWTGTGGVLTRTVAVPARSAQRMELGEQERVVVGRARIGGASWSAVWLPDLEPPVEGGDIRVVPVAHLGELLGLIVVRQSAGERAFDDTNERPLVDVARQLGLALHNVRLDSALQASLRELAERNDELQASRLRIVTAADASRRMIERNLHDGAQQHLVALAVKLGLAREVADEGDPEALRTVLADLRGEVQATITELRELAHGIYPPLLRERGLAEALRTAALRSPLACTVDVATSRRYPEAVETAAYFCCLEGMQNAAKYAGQGATVSVRVSGDDTELRFELCDDGVGFDTTTARTGHGFQNMQDRLGAIGGELSIDSAPGRGTTVRAHIPVSAA